MPSLPDSAPPARGRSLRLGRWLACTSAALAVHAGVLGGSMTARPELRAKPPLAVSRIRIDVVPTLSATGPGDAPQQKVARAAAASPPTVPAPSATLASATAPPDPAPPVVATLAALPPTAADPAVGTTPPPRFYTFDEVEVPAAPVDDWPLDAATLDSARIDRLVLDLFVDDAGQVVGCSVVEPSGIDPSVRTSIEERMRAAVLLPALRTGRPVDSTRRIELSVS